MLRRILIDVIWQNCDLMVFTVDAYHISNMLVALVRIKQLRLYLRLSVVGHLSPFKSSAQIYSPPHNSILFISSLSLIPLTFTCWLIHFLLLDLSTSLPSSLIVWDARIMIFLSYVDWDNKTYWLLNCTRVDQ